MDSAEKKHRIIVIGAGPGGLTAAMLLAHQGFDVTVFEKHSQVGGRSGQLRVDDHSFDIGSTLLTMKFLLDEIFENVGRKTEDYLQFVPMDPMYRLFFGSEHFDVSSDHDKMKAELQRVFPGNENGLDRMLDREKQRYQLLYPALQKNYGTIFSMLQPALIKGMIRFGMGQTLYDVMADYFDNDRLKMAFSFQSLYLGMPPWECPGGLAVVPYLEHEFGINYIMGGINRIFLAMQKIIEEDGGKIVLNSPVRRLLLDDTSKAASGVVLENGEVVEADEVIVNADFAYAMTEFVEPGTLKKYSEENNNNLRFSCSTFNVYLGLDRLYDLPHHNFFFAHDYRKNMDDIYRDLRLSDDLSIYVANPGVTDPTVAPAGHSSVYVLVPVPNLKASIDWASEKETFEAKILDFLENRAGMTSIREHLKFSKVISPSDWSSSLNVHLGAVFNLAHDFNQLLYFRPHNKFDELDRCYIVGGGTNPGSGMPTIFESGRIASNMICKKYGMTPSMPRPLPV